MRALSPRRVQLALAALWGVDALLQLQPANFSNDLVLGTILGNAENQPAPIYNSLVWASGLLDHHAVALNIAIIVIQLGLAIGLLWPRTTKLALAASVAWALGVWWLGEGFGGVFAGTASTLVGGPGPALLYALLALVAWPVRSPLGRAAAGTVAGAGRLGDRGTRAVWVVLWVGGAVLRVVPFWFAPVYALQGDFQMSLNEEPHWFAQINDRLSHLAGAAGLDGVVCLAVLEALIGLGVLTRHRRAFLSAGIALSVVYWVFGQQLAGLLTGSATDLGSGPLYILLALTLWPRGRFTADIQRRRAELQGHVWSGAAEISLNAADAGIGGQLPPSPIRSRQANRSVATAAGELRTHVIQLGRGYRGPRGEAPRAVPAPACGIGRPSLLRRRRS